VLELGDDGEPERALVPAGALLTVGDEELDMIDLFNFEHGVFDPSLAYCVKTAVIFPPHPA
jgi:hypothetical protein